MYKRFLEWIASAKGMRQLINIYGPYFGAGVKATYIDKDFRQARAN